MTDPFTTAGLGVIPGTGGNVDAVVRSQAWQEAHPGGTAAQDEPNRLCYAARWAGGEVAATAYGSLGALMDQLDQVEADGGCPVHRKAAEAC
jgi:hypothetical protein